MIGGLTRQKRGKAFRLLDEMEEYSCRVLLRMNDNDSRSFRARTLAAKRLANLARELHRTLAKT